MPKRFMATQCPMLKRSTQFLEVLGQEFAQAAESCVPIHVSARVCQCARDVLNVNGVGARSGLETEGAERLEIALQCHQIEPAPELTGVLYSGADTMKREEECDQLVD